MNGLGEDLLRNTASMSILTMYEAAVRIWKQKLPVFASSSEYRDFRAEEA